MAPKYMKQLTAISFALILFAVACNKEQEFLDRDWMVDRSNFVDKHAPEEKAEALRIFATAHALVGQHRYKEALPLLVQSIRLYPQDDAYYDYGTAIWDTDLVSASKAFSLVFEYSSHGALALYNVACAESLLHNPAKASSALNDAFWRGYDAGEHVLNDPDLLFLRSQPEWENSFGRHIRAAIDIGRRKMLLPSHTIQGPTRLYSLCADGKAKFQSFAGPGGTQWGTWEIRGITLNFAWNRELCNHVPQNRYEHTSDCPDPQDGHTCRATDTINRSETLNLVALLRAHNSPAPVFVDQEPECN